VHELFRLKSLGEPPPDNDESKNQLQVIKRIDNH